MVYITEHGIPIRLNSSTPRDSYALQLSNHRRTDNKHLRIQNMLLWSYNNAAGIPGNNGQNTTQHEKHLFIHRRQTDSNEGHERGPYENSGGSGAGNG